LPRTIESPATLGLDADNLMVAAKQDEAIAEFSRFYLERRAQEIEAAGTDMRKRNKLEDDFTPRIETTLVGAAGNVHPQLGARARYRIDEFEYSSLITVTPLKGKLADTAPLGRCAQSGKTVPASCLDRCQISGQDVLRHLLVRSEVSARMALPERTVRCSLSGKRVLTDEVELSAISGLPVVRELLKRSALSGKRAEPSHFEHCQFTNAEVLSNELATSEVSGKRYRVDERVQSAVSGKTGHRSEFLICHETRQLIAASEAEKCEVSGNTVRPGILERCDATKKRVLPSEIERCAVTGTRVLKRLLVTSSVSEARVRDNVAVRSAAGKFCAPLEAAPCAWSGQHFRPDDIRFCSLTGLPIHFQFVTSRGSPRLRPLVDLLDGTRRSTDLSELWPQVTTKASAVFRKGRFQIEAAVSSPDKKHLAVCCEVRTMLGLRTHQAGMVYSIAENSIAGRVVQGKRTADGWLEV
jgi:hypothetical protein